MTTPIAGLPELASAQIDQFATHNEALRMFEALSFRAISNSVTAQPGSPSNGDVYILGATHTGTDWAGYAQHDVAIYNSGWSNVTPWEGLTLWVNSIDQHVTFNSSTWTADRIRKNGVDWIVGSGSPEGAVTAAVGSLFSRTDGGAGTSLYVKESGAGNTGWIGK